MVPDLVQTLLKNPLFDHLLVVAGVLLIALSILLVLQVRSTPQSAVAWILFIILLPYIGVPIFLALGFRKQRRGVSPRRFTDGPRELSADLAARLPDGAADAARLFRSTGAAPVTTGNALEIHRDDAHALAELNRMIDGATHDIDALFYILRNDAAGRAFVERLTARAQAGVTVRLGLDRLGTLKRPRKELAALVAAGGEVRYVSPFLHLRNAGNLNLRNHRKLVLTDAFCAPGRSATLWTGGRNIGNSYLLQPPGGRVDLSFTATGPIAAAFGEVFASDWLVAGGKDLRAAAALAVTVAEAEQGKVAEAAPPPPATGSGDGPALQLVSAGPDEPKDGLHDGLVAAIHRARDRVWIATPYFIPTEPLALALANAARSGRDVRIFVPGRSDQWTADFARGTFLREVERAGARILRHDRGMMHAKLVLIDGWSLTGSANFDIRSMRLNFECMVAVYDSATSTALEAWFLAASEGAAEPLPPSRLHRRILERLFRLGAPML
ncbi:phospholipase D-like domain-containing protein [Neotabrizicola sp. sgz301269]|uniref:phospholipase D-like domain-containing protein n=1 Tax=Neotabrizicola sp. sgz301269 TaxID=3276282 RepID=UPI00376F5CEE